MKHILYLAKEPDAGVRDDLSRLSGKEVTVVDCLDAYGDYYRKMGYNVISKTKYFELDLCTSLRQCVSMLLLVTHHMGQRATYSPCWLVISYYKDIELISWLVELSDDIRMVLPLSFKKVSIQNKVSLDISVVEEDYIYQRILSLTVSGQCINAGQRLALLERKLATDIY